MVSSRWVPRIESIRPAETFESSSADHSLADLFIGILRGNLTGRLDVDAPEGDGGTIYFRHGVPVAVEFDHSPAVSSRGPEESEFAVRERIAKDSILRLFLHEDTPFLFKEGVGHPRDLPLVVLQPLPLIFQGLLRHPVEVDAFLSSLANDRFVLTPTYPRNVDPFGWGPRIEAAIGLLSTPRSPAELISAGLGKEEVGAALLSLRYAGMVDVVGDRHLTSPTPARPERVAELRAHVASSAGSGPSPRAAKEVSGLVVRRGHRSEGAVAPIESSPRGTRLAPSSAASVVAANPPRLETLRKRMSPLFDKSYFQILRVAPGTDAAQVERAFRHLMRRVEDEPDHGTRQALAEVYRECFECLSDADLSRRYQRFGEAERRVFEADAKIGRAIRALLDGRMQLAAWLVEWARMLDPSRSDVAFLSQTADALQFEDGSGEDSPALEPSSRATARAKLLQVLSLAKDGDVAGARDRLREVGETSHPVARLLWNRLIGG